MEQVCVVVAKATTARPCSVQQVGKQASVFSSSRKGTQHVEQSNLHAGSIIHACVC